MEFSSDIRLINLELFDAAFPIAPDEGDAVQRRFMTLFAQDAGARRGGSGEVLKVSNAQGETFALKRLHVAKSQDAIGNDGGLDARADGEPVAGADGELDAPADGESIANPDNGPVAGPDALVDYAGAAVDAKGAAVEASMVGLDDYSTSEAAIEDIAANRKKVLRNSISASGERSGTTGAPDYVTQGHVAAFYEEYRVQLAVSNLRGFPRVYGFGLSDGNPLIVMEWVEGMTLRDAMRERNGGRGANKAESSSDPAQMAVGKQIDSGKARDAANDEALLPLETIADLGIAVLELLARAGELDDRFVHRDISPRNIMLRGDRVPPEEQLRTGNFDLCLLDFGSSALSAFGDVSDPTFTMQANIWRMGTPAYAPPEMLSADVELPAGYRQSTTIDTYALCSVLYELYAGRKPYCIAPRDEVSPYRLKTETLPDALVPRSPDGGALAGTIMAGLSPQQEDRPDVAELRTALENWKAAPGSRVVGVLRGTKPGDRNMWQPGYARKAFTRRAALAAGIVAIGAVAAGVIAGTKKQSRVAMVDPTRYETTDRLYAGEPLFKVLDGKRPGWALCNAAGDIVCKPASSRECGALREGLVALYDDVSQLYGYVTPVERSANADDAARSAAGTSASGYAWYILPAFAQASDFSESLAAAQDADSKLWGFVGGAGTWAVEPRFRAVGPFSNGIASVQASDADALWGAIDVSGTWAIEPRFAALGARSAGGYAIVQDETGRWGIVDAQGSWTGAVRFANIRQIGDCQQTAGASSGSATQASLALAPAFDEAAGLWGYVDPSCAWVITPAFRDARPFCENLAAVQDERTQLWHFIDPDGSPHGGMKPRYWKLGDLHDGLAPAQASASDDVVVFDESDPDARSEFAGMRYGYVDAAGEWQMKRLTTLVDTAIG